MSLRRPSPLIAIALLVGGCLGDDDAPGGTVDAGSDSGVMVAPVADPALGPCVDGYRTASTASGLSYCEPWPESGWVECGDAEWMRPGASGCAPVGPACSGGEFADDLPADRALLHVLTGASAGDGSASRPYGLIGEALTRANRETVVALGRGRWDSAVRIPAEVTLWGNCTAETVITSGPAGGETAVIEPAGAGVEVRRLRIADTTRAGIVAFGSDKTIHLENVSIERTALAGIAMVDGASLTASGLLVRDTGPGPADFGRGLTLESGSSADIEDAVFEGNHQSGVYGGMASSVRLASSVVRGTRGRASDGTSGRALQLESGSSAEVQDSVFEHNREVALYVGGAGTMLTGDGIIVRDTQAESASGTGGLAMNVQLGGVATIARLLADRSHELGVSIIDTGSQLSLSDAIVNNTRAAPADDLYGRGVDVAGGAQASLTRVALEHNLDIGVSAMGGGTMLALSDVTVRDTRSLATGLSGRGLNVQQGAQLTLSRGRLTGNREASVFALGAGTSATLTGVSVLDTLPRECASSSCATNGAGHAVGAYDATVRMTDFSVRGAAVCGVHIVGDSQVDLMDGVVAGSTIGACLQAPGFDPARISDGVSYQNNETNLDATELPVPDAAGALAETRP